MKRLYFCIALVALILLLTGYSTSRVRRFADEINVQLEAAVDAIRQEDQAAARRAVLLGAALCEEMRSEAPLYLRTEDFTELEASLRATDGYLELGAQEEALGELRRASVQTENLDRLSRRWL